MVALIAVPCTTIAVKNRFTFIIFAYLSTEQCGLKHVETEFIAGPRNTPETNPVGDWPWMASIGFFSEDNKWQHQCGATLISSRHFLTAAHCAEDRLA